MPPRRVHTVHLTAPSDTLLRRGTVLLEDALHTASLPDADSSRLWFVRSLNVGTIHAKRSPATLALTIEQQLRHLRLSAVYGSDPAAATATIVYFHDITDAYCEFALRLTQSATPTEWFWRSLLPEWNPTVSNAIALKTTLVRLLQTPAQVMAVAALLHRLQQANRVASLLQILEPEDGEVLLQACGWSNHDFVPQSTLLESTYSESTYSESTFSESTFSELTPFVFPHFDLKPWLRQWGDQDARSLWLATIALLVEQPHRRFDPQLIQRAQIWIYKSLQSTPIISDINAHTLNHWVEITDVAIAPVHESKLNLQNDTELNSTEHAKFLAPTTPDESNVPSETPQSQPGDSFSQSLYRSAYAGFFGIIPLLNQLGFSRRYNNLPLEFPAQLLRALARGIPASDPIQQWLTRQDLDALFPGIAPLATVTPEIVAWRAGMRGWCRRYVGMTLADLIARPGAFALTRTHLDIFFSHDQSDIRIRRAGLDLDPGWVPWLGRVVLFHYNHY
jgi:hypothetical protein